MTREHVKCLISFPGGMAERLNAPVLKTGRVLTGSRGFESHSLRSLFLIDVWESRILRWGVYDQLLSETPEPPGFEHGFEQEVHEQYI